MTGGEVVHWLQFVNGVVWLWVVFLTRTMLVALWRKGLTRFQEVFVTIPVVGITFVARSLRWWIFPGSIAAMPLVELTYWMGCYALEIIAGVVAIRGVRIWMRGP